MKLLFLLGDQAVGKMTVGQELAKITQLRLFHNHMTIELVYDLFGNKNEHWNTIGRLRQVLCEDFAESNQYGMIYTRALDFSNPNFAQSLAQTASIFERHGADIYYCELYAPLEVRLARNNTEHRHKHKPSKRDDFDESIASMMDTTTRRYSLDGEAPWADYLRIENSNLPPETAAAMIKSHFDFK